MSDENSDSRADRSRSNGSKNRGPATDTGKAVSSKNAFRHGLRSEFVVIAPLESPEEWEAHLASLTEALVPRNYVETFIVARIALQSWKLRRVTRAQAAAATARRRTVRADLESSREAKKYQRVCEMGRPPGNVTDSEVTNECVQRLVLAGDGADILDRYEVAAERAFFRALAKYRVNRSEPLEKGA